jgi:hypothetical protein
MEPTPIPTRKPVPTEKREVRRREVEGPTPQRPTVNAGFDEVLGLNGGDHISADYVQMRVVLLQPFNLCPKSNSIEFNTTHHVTPQIYEFGDHTTQHLITSHHITITYHRDLIDTVTLR